MRASFISEKFVLGHGQPAKPPCVLPPLVVDLDGTLLKTDLLLESLLVLVKEQPLRAFTLLPCLVKSKADFKREVARRVSLDVSLLPYRKDVLDYLRTQRAQGRSIVLTTASDVQSAQQVAEHLQLFDSVFASDGFTNLSGDAKRDRLVGEFGEKGFDYAANGRTDLAVWRSARKAIAVNLSSGAMRVLEKVAEPEIVFQAPARDLRKYRDALRAQQWLKNLLVLVPLFAAHEFFKVALLSKVLLAFLSFCCFASSGYLFNDLFDAAADRHHPRKRLRPFAAGDVPLTFAFLMIPVLVAFGGILGALVSPLFLGIVLSYFLLALVYSLFIKKVVVLDVIVLAALYTLRLVGGSAAVTIWPSNWLLAFSIFLFLSLALVKRYGELVVMRIVDGDGAKARSYQLSDAELLASMGTASGYLAVLVLALYLTTDIARALYTRLELLWLLCPLLLYWIGRIWLVAHRGLIHDDPILFVTTDRTCRILVFLMIGTILLAI